MEMMRTQELMFEYLQYNENEDAQESFTALRHVDMAVQKGEFVAVLGHNGSGKSTLAKHLNALLTPTKGIVWVNGWDTSDAQNTWLIRQSAGMVFQNPDNQMVATIVEDDVAFGPENLGVPSEEIRERVQKALSSVGMLEHLDESPHFLSGGQKQRVAIAGILAMKPECIVLDEPTAMLDPVGRKEVMETILHLNQEEHITMILITHYMDEAVQADRVIVMENGEIAMEGTPKQVFSQVEQVKSLGLDVPQVTAAAGLLRKKGIMIDENILTVEEMIEALSQLKRMSIHGD